MYWVSGSGVETGSYEYVGSGAGVYEAFGAAGHASQIKPISLLDMAKRYESGELDPVIKL